MNGSSIAGFPRSNPPGELMVIAIESATGTSATPRIPQRAAARSDSRGSTRSRLSSASDRRTGSEERSTTVPVFHVADAGSDARTTGQGHPLLLADKPVAPGLRHRAAATERTPAVDDLGGSAVGDTGLEPMTSSV